MIVLVGFMGSGKTTTGRLLARHLGLRFTDTDDLVVERTGRPIAEVFADDGEQVFRDLEEAAVADALQQPAGVVSLGGGACGRRGTRARLAPHTVVHLDVSFGESQRRTRGDTGRPMLARPGLADLHAERRAVFAELATVTVTVDGRAVDDVVRDILDVVPAAVPTAGGPRQPEDR